MGVRQQEERNADDDGTMIEENQRVHQWLLEDVSTLEPIKAEATTEKEKREAIQEKSIQKPTRVWYRIQEHFCFFWGADIGGDWK